MNHYRCLNFFVPSTSGERISDTAQLYPTVCETPSWTQLDEIAYAATQLTEKLQQHNTKKKLQLKHEQHQTLMKLAEIFKTHASPTNINSFKNCEVTPQTQTVQYDFAKNVHHNKIKHRQTDAQEPRVVQHHNVNQQTRVEPIQTTDMNKTHQQNKPSKNSL